MQQIGRFRAQYYEVSGMVLRFRKRREHLSKQKIKENKAEAATVKRVIWEAIKGNFAADTDDADDGEVISSNHQS